MVLIAAVVLQDQIVEAVVAAASELRIGAAAAVASWLLAIFATAQGTAAVQIRLGLRASVVLLETFVVPYRPSVLGPACPASLLVVFGNMRFRTPRGFARILVGTLEGQWEIAVG